MRKGVECAVWLQAAGCSASVRSACLQLMGQAENIEITTSIPRRYRVGLYYFREQVTDT